MNNTRFEKNPPATDVVDAIATLGDDDMAELAKKLAFYAGPIMSAMVVQGQGQAKLSELYVQSGVGMLLFVAPQGLEEQVKALHQALWAYVEAGKADMTLH